MNEPESESSNGFYSMKRITITKSETVERSLRRLALGTITGRGNAIRPESGDSFVFELLSPLAITALGNLQLTFQRIPDEATVLPVADHLERAPKDRSLVRSEGDKIKVKVSNKL